MLNPSNGCWYTTTYADALKRQVRCIPTYTLVYSPVAIDVSNFRRISAADRTRPFCFSDTMTKLCTNAFHPGALLGKWRGQAPLSCNILNFYTLITLTLRGCTLGTRAAEHKGCNWGMQIDWWLQPRAVFGHTFSGILCHMPQKWSQFSCMTLSWWPRHKTVSVTFTFYIYINLNIALWCKWLVGPWGRLVGPRPHLRAPYNALEFIK